MIGLITISLSLLALMLYAAFVAGELALLGILFACHQMHHNLPHAAETQKVAEPSSSVIGRVDPLLPEQHDISDYYAGRIERYGVRK